MKRIRIQLTERERSCAVDAGELQAWSKSLLDEILFAAARQVTAPPSSPAVCALFEFRVTHDDGDGSIIVEYGYDESRSV
jgi:hypothetical protein